MVRREADGLNWGVRSAGRGELPGFLYLGERNKRIWKLAMAAGRVGSVGQMGGW